jgi:hypothetical protein
MNAERLVAGLVDCYNDRRLEDLTFCYASGATVHPAGWPEAVNVPSWIAAFEMMLESFPDLTIRPRHVASGLGVAVLEARLTGTNRGPFHLGEVDRLVLGTESEQLPPTGRAVDILGTVVLELTDGRVAAERHYWPLVDTLVQLGLVETQPAPA